MTKQEANTLNTMRIEYGRKIKSLHEEYKDKTSHDQVIEMNAKSTQLLKVYIQQRKDAGIPIG